MRLHTNLAAIGIASAVALAAATAPPTSAAAPGHQAKPSRSPAPKHRLQVINMDIDFKPHTRPEQGKLAGFEPVVAEVHVGDRIQFTNTDDNQHTATGYAFGGQRIPSDYRFQGDPTVPHGDTINASEWSTGNVRPHSRASRIFKTGPTGTFYYACAYHQKIMRGAIVVKP
ncbi:MAG: hypothetical protein JOZ24_05160 [Candidatus Eremiobacteraeota bacterium]|nr:hypothetical protein [Candidatus Eremiobacteraeota bacterium]